MSSLAFVGDFHPVAVHFPIALLPLLLTLVLLRRWRPAMVSAPIVSVLLWLVFASCVVAVALGWVNRAVNGHSGEAVDAHALAGLLTTASVLLAVLIDSFPRQIASLFLGARRFASVIYRIIRAIATWVIRSIWKVLHALLLPIRLALGLLCRVLRFATNKLLPRWEPAIRARLKATTRSLRQQVTALSRALPVPDRYTWQIGILVISLLLVLVTGLRGADLSHGQGHLTRNMPPMLQAMFGGTHESLGQGLDRDYFEVEVAPVLRRSCVKCHGQNKQRKGLRLDSYEAVVASGVVHYRNPYDSELLRRILLPSDHSAAMPPADKGRPVLSEDIAVIVRWLQGHSAESLAQAESDLPDDLKALGRKLPPLENAVMAELNSVPGLSVLRVVNQLDLLQVKASFVSSDDFPHTLRALQAVADHVIELDLSQRHLTQQQWQHLSHYRNLRRLNLANTNADALFVSVLGSFDSLRWLNLHGTAVDMANDQLKKLVPTLETVYLTSDTNKITLHTGKLYD